MQSKHNMSKHSFSVPEIIITSFIVGTIFLIFIALCVKMFKARKDEKPKSESDQIKDVQMATVLANKKMTLHAVNEGSIAVGQRILKDRSSIYRNTSHEMQGVMRGKKLSTEDLS